MTYKHLLLIKFLIADVTDKEMAECEDILKQLPEYLKKDAIDAFEKFGYEMAKGMFENELKAN